MARININDIAGRFRRLVADQKEYRIGDIHRKDIAL
jgi:hypothetical protein